MIVYKVVKNLEDGRLVSAVTTHQNYWLSYEVGKTTYPRYGKILAFSNLAAAKHCFLNLNIGGRNANVFGPDRRLYRAETTGAAPIHKLVKLVYDYCIRQFWEGPMQFSPEFEEEAPEGTVGCPDLTLLEEVRNV